MTVEESKTLLKIPCRFFVDNMRLENKVHNTFQINYYAVISTGLVQNVDIAIDMLVYKY